MRNAEEVTRKKEMQILGYTILIDVKELVEDTNRLFREFYNNK